jgi:hypothetical protein
MSSLPPTDATLLLPQRPWGVLLEPKKKVAIPSVCPVALSAWYPCGVQYLVSRLVLALLNELSRIPSLSPILLQFRSASSPKTPHPTLLDIELLVIVLVLV